MSQKITTDAGDEIEVYTADEVQAQVKAKEDEFGTVKSKLEEDLSGARKALADRAGEFTHFRKLNDDVVAKLSEAERTIYENGLALAKANDDRAGAEKKAYDSQVDAALRARAGTDDKLFTKMKDTWAVINIEATTTEEIERKTAMVLGAIGSTEPNLIASVNSAGGGSYMPPGASDTTEKSFADTDRGKAGAAELGLNL